MQSKIIACFLCLAILASTVGAQESQPNDSDRLKKKIESINLIYKRTLSRQYEEYVVSLKNYIEDLNEVRKKLDGTDSDEIKKIDARIERLNKELAAAETARSLHVEAEEEQAKAQPTPSPSPTLADAQLPCDCPQSTNAEGKTAKENLPAGVIWCGPANVHKLDVQTFAEINAPILWFSPDEPLRLKNKEIPHALPGDENSGSPVVYYRISEVVLKQGIPKPELDSNNLELDKIKKLTLKYYFYYPEDTGFQGHQHDLESVRLDIHFTLRDEAGDEKTKLTEASHYVAYISRVIGAAHGVTWYGNQLDIGDDERGMSLPITLLVEEGKHATSPDRNADGFYSPGYDVNKRYTDAWGVRDLLGSGQLGSAKYEGSMTKPRRPRDMIKVRPDKPHKLDAAGRPCLLTRYAGNYRTELEAAPGYRLTRARDDFETAKQREERQNKEKQHLSTIDKLRYKDKILSWVEGEKFNEAKPKMTPGDGFLLKALRFGHGIERNEEFLDAIPIAYRAEGRQHGFTILPPVGRYKVFFLDGYFLPKMNFMFPGTRTGAIPGRKASRPIRFSLEAMYTPSASRTFDWYATMGAEWARPDPSLGYASRFVQEGGLRFRFNRGNWLVGGRLGLRVTGFAEARSPRFIFELGTGAF